MKTKYEAANSMVWVIRDEPVKEVGGFELPDQAIQKANKGNIYSVGEEVTDKRCKAGRKAIFTKQVGQDLSVGSEIFVILRQDQVLGYE